MELREGGGRGIIDMGQLSVPWLCIMLAMQKWLAPAHSNHWLCSYR